MNSLNQDIARFKATNNAPALQHIAEGLGKTVERTQERVEQLTKENAPRHKITPVQRCLNQAESNWVLVQAAVDFILKGNND